MTPAPAPSTLPSSPTGRWQRWGAGWSRTVVVLAVAVLVPLGGLTAVALTASTGAVQRQADARALDSAGAAAGVVDRQLAGLGLLLDGYANSAALQRAVADPDAPGAVEHVSRVAREMSHALHGSAGAVITDGEGRLLRSFPHVDATVGGDFSGREWFQGAVSTQGTHVSSGYRTKGPGEPYAIAVSVALRGGDERDQGSRLLGVLVVTLRVDALSASLASAAPTDGRLLVTDRAGQLVAAPHHDDIDLQDQSHHAAVQQALAGASGVTAEDAWIEGYAPVPRWGWTVRAELPRDLALAETAGLRRTVLLAATAVAGVFVLALALLAAALRRREAADRALGAAATEIEDRQRFTEALLQTMDTGVIACDAAGRFTYANGEVAHLTGLAPSPGQSVEEWAADCRLRSSESDDWRPSQLPVLRALLDGTASGELLAQDERALQVHARAIRDGSGRTVGAVSVAHDVTVLKEREQALAQARDEAVAAARAKASFLAAVSHEIRTPLNGVLGMLDLMLVQPLTDEQRDRAVIARDSGRTLLRLLTDVLDLSKGDAGRLLPAPRSTSLVPLLEHCVSVFAGVAERKALALRLEVAPDLPADVLIDAERVTQVVLNVLGNAVKFTAHGSVVLEAATASDPRAGSAVRLRVRDTGPGLTDEDRAALFVPFQQGSAGQQAGGTGLGLALTAQVVEALGGTIEVDSRLGSGTVFTIALPCDAAPAPLAELVPVQARPADEVPPAARLQGLRALVAEDNAVNQLVARAMLDQLGVEAVLVEDGQQALDAARDQQFDVVLLDWQMPVLDGLEAARRLRALPGYAHVAVIGLTARTFPEDEQECLDAGMDRVLGKPYRQEELAEALSTTLAAAARAGG